MKKLLCILAGRLPGLLLVVGCILLSGCPEQSETRIDDQGASYSAYDWQLPEGIPLPREPANNPMTEAKFQLGRHLFYDKRLSMNATTRTRLSAMASLNRWAPPAPLIRATARRWSTWPGTTP